MDVRPSPIAGKWYAADPNILQQNITTYLGDSPQNPYNTVYGVLAPHAGMRFSGGVAGAAFRHLRGRQYDVVVVIAPSHHAYPHQLLTSGHDAYQTPFGTIPIAKQELATLHSLIDLTLVRDDPEHAIEIELPFLQVTLGDFALLPIAMLQQDFDTAQALATALTENLSG